MSKDLTAQERAAIVTERLCRGARLSLVDVQYLTGLKYSGAWYLMSKISRVLPACFDVEERVFYIANE